MTVRHKHIAELQSLRGLAALVVVLHHCLYYFVMPDGYYPEAETLFNGHAAVVAFFVLSGYVLTVSLQRAPIGHNEVVGFLLRRIFRLYPAIWVTCTVSLVLLLLINHNIEIPNRSDWAAQFFRPANQNLKSVAASLFGLGTFLVPPMWSITVELAGSVLVLLMAITSRGRPVVTIAYLIVLAVLSFLLPTYSRATIIVIYLVHFAMGASLPLWSGRLGSCLGSRSAVRLALLCVGVMAAFRLVGGWDFKNFFNAPLPGLVEGTAAAVLIALIVERRDVFSLMASRPLVSLGDISFSLYLIHFPIMVALTTVGAGMLGLPIFASWPLSAIALIAVTVPCSILLAYFSYHLVELQGIRLGNWVLSLLLHPPKAQHRQIHSNVTAD